MSERSTHTKKANGRQVRKNLEVDFVANQGHRRYYIQFAYQIPDDARREQENRPLRTIRNAFRKIVIFMTIFPPTTTMTDS